MSENAGLGQKMLFMDGHYLIFSKTRVTSASKSGKDIELVSYHFGHKTRGSIETLVLTKQKLNNIIFD